MDTMQGSAPREEDKVLLLPLTQDANMVGYLLIQTKREITEGEAVATEAVADLKENKEEEDTEIIRLLGRARAMTEGEEATVVTIEGVSGSMIPTVTEKGGVTLPEAGGKSHLAERDLQGETKSREEKNLLVPLAIDVLWIVNSLLGFF